MGIDDMRFWQALPERRMNQLSEGAFRRSLPRPEKENHPAQSFFRGLPEMSNIRSV
jgi:hypothetical protein